MRIPPYQEKTEAVCFSFIPAFLVASAIVSIFSGPAEAWNQNPQGVDMGPSECYSCGSSNNDSYPDNPSYQGPSEHAIWRAKENARLERKAQADVLYGQASAAWDRRDFREALRYFREQQGVIDGPNVRDGIAKTEALVVWSEATNSSERRRAIAMNPGAFSQDNLRYVDELEAYEKYQARLESDRQTTSQMKSRIGTFADTMVGEPVSTTISGTVGPDAFGTQKAQPDLEFGDPNPVPGTNVDSGAQLKSAQKHSFLGGLFGDSREAQKGFDTAGEDDGVLVYGQTSAGRPQPVFVTNLPESAKKDPRIRQSVAFYEKLDKLKYDTVRKIEAVKKEQQTGNGDPAVLEAKLGTLTHDLIRQESDQARAKETMKKRVKDMGFDWNESPPVPAATGAKK